MKRVTIKDLSKLLNLSTSTVSRALSDHPDISEATKSRVRVAAEEFNYTTNLHASLFRNKRSGLIALILPEFNMFFTPGLIDSINEVIASSKHSLIVFLSNNSLIREKEIVQQCMSWAVEGVLISLSKETTDLSHLAPLKASEIECVLLDKALEDSSFPTVTIDNVKASYETISYLIEKGHKNILGIFGNPNYQISKDRIKGYRKALTAHQIPVLEENIISVDKKDDLDFILPPILHHNHQLTAIFTMSDELLAKSFSLTRSLGKEVPKDIAIISISDGSYPYLTYPKITHMKDSGKLMGKEACNFLIDKINKTGNAHLDRMVLETVLVELGSV